MPSEQKNASSNSTLGECFWAKWFEQSETHYSRQKLWIVNLPCPAQLHSLQLISQLADLKCKVKLLCSAHVVTVMSPQLKTKNQRIFFHIFSQDVKICTFIGFCLCNMKFSNLCYCLSNHIWLGPLHCKPFCCGIWRFSNRNIGIRRLCDTNFRIETMTRWCYFCSDKQKLSKCSSVLCIIQNEYSTLRISLSKMTHPRILVRQREISMLP